MKNFYITLLLLIASVTKVAGQYTPNCTDISTHVISLAPLTPAQISSINAQQQSQFPNAVKLEDPTSSYNCHNYAFVKHDGGSEFWLNTPGDDVFWNDGSYLLTTNTGEANLRVSYQGDHSAVTTSVSNKCISKWGQWGLYRHNTTYVPASYLPNNPLTYYKKSMSITGPSTFCTSATYNANNLPSGANVTNWSATPSNAVTIADNGNSATVTKNSGYNGDVILTATIISTCGNTEVETQFSVGGFNQASISGPTGVCSGEDYYYYCNVPGGHQSGYTYTWTMPNSSWQIYSQNANWILAVPYGNDFAGQILVEVDNGCGTAIGGLIAYPYCPGNYSYSIYPNPNNTGYLQIDVVKTDSGGEDIVETSSTTGLDNLEKGGELAVEVYDFSGNLIFPKKSLGNASRVDVSSLKKGIYLLYVYHNEQITKKKVIIE